VEQTLQIYVMKQLLLPHEKTEHILKMKILNKLQKELWLGMLKKDYQIKKLERELLFIKQDMLYVDGS
jgi:hypothetical protein